MFTLLSPPKPPHAPKARKAISYPYPMPQFLRYLSLVLLCCAKAGAEPGLRADLPINHKLFSSTEGYFEGRVPNKIYRAYKKNKVPASWKANGMSPEACIEYDASEQSAVTYVPDSYDGNTPFGIYIHISPSNKGISPSLSWKELMETFQLIYISPNKTQNATPSWRRIALAMDSLATAKSQFNIEEDRVFIGGLSGGGHIAMMCQMIYPEFFQGAISHAAQSYLPSKKHFGHFPGLRLTDAQSTPRKEKKWVVISGNKDSNYKEILKTSMAWEDAGFKYKFFDIKGMKHQNAPGSALEQALHWIGASPKKATVTKVDQNQNTFRIWKSTVGSTLKARFIKISNGNVHLQKENGDNLQVPMNKLSLDDQQHLRDLLMN